MLGETSIVDLRNQLLARLRSRGGDRLRLPEVARRCGLEVLAFEAFLDGAQLSPPVLAMLPSILQPRPVQVNKSVAPPKETPFVLTARAIKATLTLDPGELAALAEPTTARISLRIQVDGRTVVADIAAKALRKAKALIGEHGVENATTLLQGKLAQGDILVEAGLVAEVKGPKPAPDPA